MKTLALIILSFLAMTSAFSQCENLSYIDTIEFEEGKNCDLVIQYDELIKSVAGLYQYKNQNQNHPKVLPQVDLIISKESMGASFSNSGKVMIGEVLFSLVKGTSQKVYRPLESNHITFVHEYGHAILHDLLLRHIDFYNEYNRDALEVEKVATRYNNIVKEMQSLREVNLENGNTEEEVSIAEDRLGQITGQVFMLGFEMDHLQAEFSQKHQRTLHLVGALHELYADILTVTLKKDPQAMYRSIIFEGIDTEKMDEYLYRSFIHPVNIETWNNEQAHYLFTPTRFFLGSRIDFKNLSLDEQREFLKILDGVIIEFVKENWDSPEFDSQSLNKKLMEKLEMRL